MATSEKMKDPRPTFFNLLHIALPVGALTSIAHRISGVLLALGIPFAVYLLDLSLRDAQGYARLATLDGSMAFRLPVILIIWAFSHHTLAGVRHLLSDVDVGARLPAARRSAWLVNCSAVLIALASAALLL